MAAYVIVDIEVTNPEAFEEYRQRVPPLIAKYGGKYLARGGEMEKVEGDWSPTRIVVLEFESMERVKEFYYSEEYAPLKKLRLSATKSNMVMVEGA